MVPEQEILDEVVDVLQRTGIVTVEKTELLGRTRETGIDAKLTLHFPGKTTKYLAVIKQTMTNIAVGQLAREHKGDPNKWLVITRYVYPKLGQTMRELGVEFVDTVGNVYIKEPPALIHIQAHKPQAQKLEGAERETWKRAGLKVLFALLCHPDLRNANYRTIATAAGVALGTVAAVMKDLTTQGYLLEFDDNLRRLVRRKELLNKWLTAYAVKLYPFTLVGRYTARDDDFWKRTELQEMEAQWGGEIAATMLTHYLKPEITTIYADKPLNELIFRLKLRKDEHGKVEIRKKFWGFDGPEVTANTVPPLLVYADLMATGDARNIETANAVYEQYLERQFHED
ncbi:MAG: type IV toxin-antitoxin system AbiEi family antitoxin [Bacteroidota bacterium]